LPTLRLSEQIGTSQNDTISAHSSVLVAGLQGNDSLTANPYSDWVILVGGDGNDTYTAQDDTTITIGDNSTSKGDVLVARGISFTSDTSYAATIDGRHLIVFDESSGQQVVITDWKSTTNQIETIILEDGSYSYSEVRSYLSTMRLRNLTWAQVGITGGYSTASINEALRYYAKKTKTLQDNTAVTLTGGTYNESLSGSKGLDVIIGYQGNDILFGGEGNDTYVFQAECGNDTITVSPLNVHDTIEFDGLFLSDLEFSQSSENVVLTFGDSSVVGEKWVQKGYKNQISTAIFEDQSMSTRFGSRLSADIIKGTTGGDLLCDFGGKNSIYGYAGDDYLMGGVDNDYLEGGIGTDTIYGGLGNDTIVYDGSDILYGQAGTDWLDGRKYTVGLNLDLSTSFTDFENMIGTKYADFLVGNDKDNNLIGGIGSDTLSGGAGNDTLEGGSNKDYYRFSSGNDVIKNEKIDVLVFESDVQIEQLTAGKGKGKLITLGLSGNSVTLSQGLDVSIQGATYTLNVGSDKKESLKGTKYNDILFGLDGDDQITGAQGNDYLDAGAGNDIYYWQTGYGNDIIASSQGNDVIQLKNILLASVSYSSENLGLGTAASDLKLTFATGEFISIADAGDGTNYNPVFQFKDEKRYMASNGWMDL